MKPYVALLICLMSVALARAAAPAQPPKRAAGARRSCAASPAPLDPEQGGQPINIRLDVSVMDQTAQGANQPKSLMVMLVDRAMGRTRAAFQDRSIRRCKADHRGRSYSRLSDDTERGDAEAFRRRAASRITRLAGGIRFRSARKRQADAGAGNTDAVTKRKMSIEVKATIQK